MQPYKKGPDYIDPMWLGRAAGNACHNLDFYTMEADEILDTVGFYSRNTDISIIEGNKGLYDGLDLDGSNSNAALAKLLGSPVVLVLDARGMTRGIAPLILGYQQFDPHIHIAGVILNLLGGSRHESKLRAVIEHYTDVSVLGAIGKNPSTEILERHLGLIPGNEHDETRKQIEHIGSSIAAQTDLERILELARGSAIPADPGQSPFSIASPGQKLRIGIARDEAFGFYYQGDLEALQNAGSELVDIDTLHDQQLPAIDGLFIGGGFPESRMQALEANRSLRSSIKSAIGNGLPVYAECGGLMYLSRSLSWNDQTCEMVGVIPADSKMHRRPQGRGYVRLRETANGLWPGENPAGAEIAAHEFHYSALENLPADSKFVYQVLRGSGIDGHSDGYRYKNLLACYTHQRTTRSNRWSERFLQFVADCRDPACRRSSTASRSM